MALTTLIGNLRARPERAPSSTVPGITWSDDRVESLKKLWGEGLSAGRIAHRLGGISRSAVIGKVHRLGLSERKGSANSRRTAHLRPARKRVLHPKSIGARRSTFAEYLAAVQSSRTSMPQPVETDTVRVAFAQLDADRPHQHCRWPVGDPKQPGFGFCGCAQVPGLPYCEQHASRAYQTPDVRARTTIQTFGLEEFEPVHLPPRCSPLLARRDDGEAALAAADASPSFSIPES
jgi:GcrA cell cycle regulator